MAYPVMWFEVMGTKGAELQQFYQRLFGWQINANNPTKYGVVETGTERGIPGGVGQTYGDRSRPWVTVYVESPDITATLAEAVRLGGKELVPRKELPETVFGLFEDPEGNVIGLVEASPAKVQAEAAAETRA